MRCRKPMPGRIVFALWMMAIVAPAPALADDKVGALTIEAAWARASAGAAQAGAAYVTIRNTGRAADRLIAASTPVARRAALHTAVMKANVMRMRPVDALTIAPSATTTLKPGGNHLMLMGLHAPLVEGRQFPLTLTFENAGEVTVTVTIGGIAARGPGS